MRNEARQALVVIDQDLALDRRVELTIAGLERDGYSVAVADVRQPVAFGDVPAAFVSFAAALLAILARGILGLPRLVGVWKRWDCRRYRLPFVSSPRVMWRRTVRPLWRGALAAKQHRGARLVVANDLEALIFASAAAPRTAELYYDSHELNLFRARTRNSVSRVAVDFMFETGCIRRAQRVFTVSEPIAGVLKQLHALEKVEYRPNAFYAPTRAAAEARPTGRLHILYAGATAPGRQLETLSALAMAEPTLKVTLLIAATMPGYRLPEALAASSNVTRIDGRYSDNDLIRLAAAGDAVFMWCVIDDICLSYRLAEPSKYYQAVAQGFPVIVGDHQALADRVRETGNGLVLSREELADPLLCIEALMANPPDSRREATLKALDNYKQFQGLT